MSVKSKTVRTPATVKEEQAKALARAKEAVRKAEERLAKVKERVARIEAETTHKVRLAELAIEIQQHREALRKLRSAPSPQPEAAATVRTESGEVRPVSAATLAIVKKTLGRRTKGLLSPRQKQSQEILTALDSVGNVGDSFTLELGARSSSIRFAIESEGLRFAKCANKAA
jgi:hypothetical protein